MARQREQDHNAEAERERLKELDAVEQVSEASELLRVVSDLGLEHFRRFSREVGPERILVDYNANLQAEENH